MSIFSRIARNLKRGLRKIAPIVAPFIPGVGGLIAGLIPPRSARTPGIVPDIARPPLPGAGRVATGRQRFSVPSRQQLTGGRRIITPGPLRQEMSIFAAIPAILRGAAPAGRTIGRALTGRAAAAAGLGVALGQTFNGAGDGACPSGWHLNKQDGVGGPAGSYCVRNRRMNFGNARAARRGVRRLKGARKLLKDIEKMMPRAPARRRAPDHHHHPAAGG